MLNRIRLRSLSGGHFGVNRGQAIDHPVRSHHFGFRFKVRQVETHVSRPKLNGEHFYHCITKTGSFPEKLKPRRPVIVGCAIGRC